MVSEKWFKWLLLPGFISALLFPILLYVFYIFLTPQAWLPLWLQGYFGASIQIIASLLFTVISCWALQPLLMILLSPIFGLLAEKVELKLYGIEPTPFKVHLLILDLFRGILMVALITASMLSFLLLFWGLSFIPVIGFIFASFAIPMIQMYFAGMGFADPALERRRFGIRARWGFCWKNRFRILGLGAGYILLSMIPFIGWFIAPGYALIASSVGITELIHSTQSEK